MDGLPLWTVKSLKSKKELNCIIPEYHIAMDFAVLLTYSMITGNSTMYREIYLFGHLCLGTENKMSNCIQYLGMSRLFNKFFFSIQILILMQSYILCIYASALVGANDFLQG